MRWPLKKNKNLNLTKKKGNKIMTNLLLKTKTELFKWRARERERERERQAGRQAGRLRRGILKSCRDLYSFPCFNSKFTELIVNNTPVFFPSM